MLTTAVLQASVLRCESSMDSPKTIILTGEARSAPKVSQVQRQVDEAGLIESRKCLILPASPPSSPLDPSRVGG